MSVGIEIMGSTRQLVLAIILNQYDVVHINKIQKKTYVSTTYMLTSHLIEYSEGRDARKHISTHKSLLVQKKEGWQHKIYGVTDGFYELFSHYHAL